MSSDSDLESYNHDIISNSDQFVLSQQYDMSSNISSEVYPIESMIMKYSNNKLSPFLDNISEEEQDSISFDKMSHNNIVDNVQK